MKYSVSKSTPRNMRYAICDICGFRKHIKEMTKVTDIYNKNYGLLICDRHLQHSKTNPQQKPKVINEVLVKNLDKMRPEPLNDIYIINDNDDRLPSKPSNPRVRSDPLDGYVTLYWDAPQDQGSSPITGYIVERAIPQDVAYATLEANTETSIPSYIDTTLSDPGISATYRVAAINGFGQGPYSDEFYWPTQLNLLPSEYRYLVTSDTSLILQTGDGAYIIVKEV